MKFYRSIYSLFILSSLIIICGCRTTAPQFDPVTVEDPKNKQEEVKANQDESPGLIHSLILWAPNRFLDVFDLVRVRIRVGPGVALGIRATQYADAYAGTYAAVYAGLPGPRGRRMPRSPVGLESYNGVKASVIDATAEGGIGPNYSPTEFGGGFQLLILGFDFGVDPFEAVDLAGGFFLWDPRKDDL